MKATAGNLAQVKKGCFKTCELGELRKDYFLNRWAIIATERRKRPTDLRVKEKEEIIEGACPFCPGNEHMTPPATLLYLPSGKGIIKAKDGEGERPSNWLVRCFPNLYPALRPEGEHYGYHEVIVESPLHDEQPAVARDEQIKLVVQAYVDRTKAFIEDERIRYVCVFRNYGKRAGASLSHPHSQVIALPFEPPLIEAERKGMIGSECKMCRVIEKELEEGERIVLESENFVVFCPWAAIHPFEFWIVPKKHERSLLEAKNLDEFALLLKRTLKALKDLLNDPPYMYGFHVAARGVDFHWHLEVYPKLTEQAGFERNTGVFINIIAPEEAAKALSDYV